MYDNIKGNRLHPIVAKFYLLIVLLFVNGIYTKFYSQKFQSSLAVNILKILL